MELSACLEHKLVCNGPIGAAQGRESFHALSIDGLLKLIWCLGIVEVMPEQRIAPGRATQAPNVATAVRLVAGALQSLDNLAHGSPLKRPVWMGGGLASDLTDEEFSLISGIYPGLRDVDRGVERRAAVQLSLFDR